jgi:hypothetical protein
MIHTNTNDNYRMTPATQPQKLNPVQLHLLRFFSERQVTEQETIEIQQLISQHYAQKADKLMDLLWVDRGYTGQTMDDILNKELAGSPNSSTQ